MNAAHTCTCDGGYVTGLLLLFHIQRKPNNPPGNKKGGATAKNSKPGKSDSDSKAAEDSSTDLVAAAVGGVSLEEQSKVE